jgi:hypothetical protein
MERIKPVNKRVNVVLRRSVNSWLANWLRFVLEDSYLILSFQAESTTNLRFPEFRSAGPHLRSHEMKLPSNIGQKKMKAIEEAAEKYKLRKPFINL